MKRLLLLALWTACAVQAAPETRCGWWDNPSPGNVWLHDRDGEWEVATQGAHQAEGDWPSFSARQQVRMNGSYGYGCACLRVTVNPKTRQVLKIFSAQTRPLAQCRVDAALGKPPG